MLSDGRYNESMRLLGRKAAREISNNGSAKDMMPNASPEQLKVFETGRKDAMRAPKA